MSPRTLPLFPVFYNGPDRGRRLAHVFLRVVLSPWPEEPAQPVLAIARDEVNMQMGDALADDVVQCDEGSLGFHRRADRAREELGIGEQRLDQLIRQVPDRLVVLAGDEQRVTREERPVVEEGEARLVLEDHVRLLIARDDRAEATALERRHR